MIPGVFVAEERASPCGNIRQREQDKKKRAPAERAGGSLREGGWAESASPERDGG